jgi:hypothetical protein
MTKAITISDEEKLDHLAEEIKSILIESVFSARMTLLEAKHLVGKTIVKNPLYKKSGKGSGEIIKELARRMGRSERDIYLCIQFYEKYPKIELVVQTLKGKKNDITWAAVKRLLAGKSVEECQHQWEKAEYWRCVKCFKKVFRKPEKTIIKEK